MGYPTSVFGPSVRSNGQTIDASHINDLQTEVTAVENGLLGTITHSVNITGASTLATLQCAASTFSVRPVEPPPHAAVVFVESTLTIGSSALSTISWLSQSVLTNSSMHSTGTNPTRLTPQSTGLYAFVAQLSMTDQTDGARRLAIIDSTGAEIAQFRSNSTSAAAVIYQACGLKRFDVLGGYASVILARTGASTLSITQGLAESFFSMHKL